MTSSRESNSSDFVYLVQGRSDLTELFLTKIGEVQSIMVATWDKEISTVGLQHCQFFYIPNTTWAEGRNFLFQKAMQTYPNARYYIFCDEDVEFESICPRNRCPFM